MLSLIASFSMLAAIPLYVFSQVIFDDYDWLFARRPPCMILGYGCSDRQ